MIREAYKCNSWGPISMAGFHFCWYRSKRANEPYLTYYESWRWFLRNLRKVVFWIFPEFIGENFSESGKLYTASARTGRVTVWAPISSCITGLEVYTVISDTDGDLWCNRTVALEYQHSNSVKIYGGSFTHRCLWYGCLGCKCPRFALRQGVEGWFFWNISERVVVEEECNATTYLVDAAEMQTTALLYEPSWPSELCGRLALKTIAEHEN